MKTKQKDELRTLLVNAIIDLSADEYENSNDFLQLATDSTYSLVERLIGIADYYREECNS